MREKPRLLGRSGGYTAEPRRALAGEPEAVDAESQRKITLAAALSWPHLDALHGAERESASPSVRLRRAEAQARASRIDVRPQLRLARLAIEQGRSSGQVERRLSAVEARVFPRRGSI
jgi:hypothetical protein